MTYYAIKCEPHKDRHVRRALKIQGETVYMAAKCSKTRTRRVKGKRHLTNLVPGWVFVRAPETPEMFALWHHRVKHTKHALCDSQKSTYRRRTRLNILAAPHRRREKKA